MDREYLEDYEQKEKTEYDKIIKKMQDGKFDLEKERYPPDERFINIQRPVSDTTSKGCREEYLWGQIPLCGSLVLSISSLPRSAFEELYFKVSEIPEIIDFIKDTGRLQIILQEPPTNYEGLDFLDPIFTKLKPPMVIGLPLLLYGDERKIKSASAAFYTLSGIRFNNFMEQVGYDKIGLQSFRFLWESLMKTYVFLKLGHYSFVDDLENLIVDSPPDAFLLLIACMNFISDPVNNLRYDLLTFSFEDARRSTLLPQTYKPQKIRFPCEIGKFLLRKLTYAAQDMRACYNLIDDYDRYDLRKVQESLNEAITENHPDILNKKAEELSEIFDNVWNDKTIPNRIKNIEIGVPVSIAAVGGIVAGLPGFFAGGFLSELGFKVVEKATEKYAEKLFGVKGEGLTERLAKLRTKSYQANIYDFKKKYNK